MSPSTFQQLSPEFSAPLRHSRNSPKTPSIAISDASPIFSNPGWLWPTYVVESSLYSPSPLHFDVPDSLSASSIRKCKSAASSVNSASASSTPMPPKRPATSSPGRQGGHKQQKFEKEDDFSSSVKKKLQNSTRTGQACDRCKVRKIRCDGLETGCSPCLQAHQECKTTDRITGIATRRGQLTELQQQNDYLIDLLKRYGIPNPFENGHQLHNSQQQSQHIQQLMQYANPQQAYPQPAPGANVLPSSLYGTLLSQMSPPGSVKDILSILGMNINDVITSTSDAEVSAPFDKSYQSFLQTAHGVNPKLEKPALPERDDGLTYAQWYFKVIGPYLPVLHKASFMQLLTKVYDDPTFIPTIGEEVTVHIVFSIMLYQYAIRNLDDPSQQAYLNEESNRHYHFSLSKFYDLTVSRTLQDAQAMTLICVHLRNFSKPEACWMLSSHTLNMIKELGFHRSHKVSENSTLSGYDIEIRKRVFYTILTLNAGLSGKLGRPMPMRLDDFDIEFPSPMDDDTLAECDMPLERRSGKCRHQIGLQSFRIHALYLEMYSLIYCVRRHPETYIGTVNSLQRKLASWVENLPPELRKGSNAAQSHEGRVFALYAEIWAIEFRMLLRHPAVSLTTDAAFNAESMRIGIESSKQMYTVVKQLKELKSLDTTWYNTAIFVLAITTMLYAAWEKRAGMTMRDLDDTKLQVEEWLSIMGEIGHLLGSGNRLRDAVKTVTDRSIALLASSIKPAQQSPHPQSQSQTPTYEQPRPQQYSNHPPQYPDPTQPHQHHHNPSPHPPQHPPNYNSTPYPAATQYYPVPPSTTSPYEPTPTPTAYPAALSSSVPGNLAGYGHQDPVDAPLLAAFAEQASAQAQAAGSNDDTWRYNNLQNGVQGHGGHVQAQNGQIGGGINVGGSAGWLMFSNAISGSPHDGSVNPGLDMNAVGADEGMSAAVLLELGQGSGQGQGGMGGQMGGSVKSEGGHVVVNRMGGLNAWPGIVLDVAHPHPKQHNGGGQM